MPVKPSAGDLWALSKTVNVCGELKRPFIFVVCQAVRGASMTNQALSALSEYGAVAPIIHNRVAYAAAMGIGQTAQEMEPKSPGATEIADLWQFVQKHLRADVHKRKPEGVHTGKRARQKEAVRKLGGYRMAKKALFLEKNMMARRPLAVPRAEAAKNRLPNPAEAKGREGLWRAR
jgi:hypothetical protein